MTTDLSMPPPGSPCQSEADPATKASKNALVLMPFGPGHKDRYETVFARALLEAGFQPGRGDEHHTANAITRDIEKAILRADILLCDLTGCNLNVLYELALAHTIEGIAVACVDAFGEHAGPGTGLAAHLEKIRAMKEALGAFPLAIASGITPENVADYLPWADCFLVATGISSSFTELDPRAVASLVGAVRGWDGEDVRSLRRTSP